MCEPGTADVSMFSPRILVDRTWRSSACHVSKAQAHSALFVPRQKHRVPGYLDPPPPTILVPAGGGGKAELVQRSCDM
ncbi:hypothetical protein GCM10017559_71900 [Streptosporangium longisporum]|uniref:Uncharacterized protein n=1 Tax=Streptosporangium longisporum TaxID=46187 RepID=A0ABP6L6J9_9ACTN